MENALPDLAQQLFNLMPSGVVFHDKTGAIIFANPAASELLGLSINQLLGRSPMDERWHALHSDGTAFPGDTHPASLALKNAETIKNVEMGVFHPIQQSYKWLLVNAVPEFLPNEKSPYRIFVTFSDITEQKNAEKALKDSKFQLTERLKELNCVYQINWLSENSELSIEEYLQKAVELIPDGYQYPNQTSAQINFGTEVYKSKGFKETNSKMFTDFHLNHSKKGFLTIYNPEDTPFLKEEYQLLDNLRRTIEVHLNKRVVKHRLLESENRLKNLLNSQTSYVLRTNLDGLHTYWNQTFEAEFGWLYYEAGLQNGNSLASICEYHHERTFATVEKCISNPGVTFQVELDKPNKTGGIKTTFWEFVCLTDEHNKPLEIQCMGIDISERRKMELELRENEQRLQAIADHSQSVIWELNTEGVYTYVSKIAADIYGFEPEELVGKKYFYDLHPEEHKDEFIEHAYEILNNKKSFSKLLNPIQRKDGKVIWVETNATPKLDEQGNLLGYIGADIDVTERLAMEAELDKFKVITDQANYGTAITDIHGIMQYVNPKFAEQHGYAVQELIGKPIPILHSPAQMPEVEKLLGKIKTDGGFEATEVGHCKKDGTEFPTLMSTKLFVDEQGLPAYMSATVIDITENKAQEEIIKQQNQRLSAIIDAMPDMVFICDKEGNYLEYFRSSTYSQQDDYSYLVGKNVRDAFTSEIAKLHVQVIQDVLRTGKMVSYEFPKKEGDIIKYFEARVVAINENQVLRFIRDITSRKEKDFEILELNKTLERRILERTKQLEQSNLDLNYARVVAEEANRSKSEFLSRMSHELRTPMNSILGFAQLLQMGELDEAQEKSVNHILNSGKHLLGLINEVLDISRIESGKISVSVESVNIKRCITEIKDTLLPLANARNIELIVDDTMADNLFVHADNQRLKQVLTNLINNGIKYNKPYGKVILKTESIQIKEKDYYKINVIDDGIGIAEKNLHRIFNPFERLEADSTGTEGTGLGLAVVKQLADLMQGKIGVESKVGVGSTFWIALPAGENHHEKIKQQSEDKQSNIQAHKAGNILYIEDNISNIELIRQVLSNARKSIKLETSITGKNGFEMAKTLQPDLILLDLNLPDAHGSEILTMLKNDSTTSQIPVVIISADAMADQRVKLMSLGAKGYLTKPIEVVSLLNTIDQFI
jgi:PAS domain S-box-containing protein